MKEYLDIVKLALDAIRVVAELIIWERPELVVVAIVFAFVTWVVKQSKEDES